MIKKKSLVLTLSLNKIVLFIPKPVRNGKITTRDGSIA